MSRSSPGVLALAVLAGCSSHAETVCEDIGDCSQGGDNVWITTCQANAKLLGTEASGAGCGPDYDAYYACADAAYTCTGATATFPGCGDRLAALDACLAAATAGTSCVRLVTDEATCGSPGPDGGVTSPDAGVPAACTAARDCIAACYLGSVANVCAPGVTELEAAQACGATCPP